MQTPNSTTPKTPKPSTRKIDEIQEFLDLYYISWFRINQTYNLWAQCHGIQDSTMFLLDEIHRNPEYCTQSMLVSKVLLPKQTVSSALKKMEEAGLIVRENNPKDKRNKFVRLTPEGQIYADALMGEMEQAEVDAFLSLTPEQQDRHHQGAGCVCQRDPRGLWQNHPRKKKEIGRLPAYFAFRKGGTACPMPFCRRGNPYTIKSSAKARR
ncbi:MAG: MarR family transcriptional regulator [Clostridiales bacterium]|nr:MarR family transcriptional regulator [Clostridiales bacterium]